MKRLLMVLIALITLAGCSLTSELDHTESWHTPYKSVPQYDAEPILTAEVIKAETIQQTDFCNRIEAGEDLNAMQFADGFYAWINGDLGRAGAINYWNSLILENNGTVLTATEETEIDSIKGENDSFGGTANKLAHYLKVQVYMQAVQDGRATCAWAEPKIGL